MAISESTYYEVKSKFGDCASWAIWADEEDSPTSNIGDISIFEPENNSELFEILQPEIIFVALNFSRGSVNDKFANFHSSYPYAKDHKIRYAIRNSPFWGGYMTDLIKNHSEKKSKEVKKMLKTKPHIVSENIDILRKEIEILDVQPTLIAFGREVEMHLRNHLSEYPIIFIPHYSAGGNNPAGRLNNRDNYKADVRKILCQEFPCNRWD